MEFSLRDGVVTSLCTIIEIYFFYYFFFVFFFFIHILLPYTQNAHTQYIARCAKKKKRQNANIPWRDISINGAFCGHDSDNYPFSPGGISDRIAYKRNWKAPYIGRGDPSSGGRDKVSTEIFAITEPESTDVHLTTTHSFRPKSFLTFSVPLII